MSRTGLIGERLFVASALTMGLGVAAGLYNADRNPYGKEFDNLKYPVAIFSLAEVGFFISTNLMARADEEDRIIRIQRMEKQKSRGWDY